MVYTGQDKIHKLLIERNITHFSKAEATPQGINGFIYNALGPYGISNFSDRVLKGEMTEEEKASFDMAEAAELFEATSKPEHDLAPEEWALHTLERLKRKVTGASDNASNSIEGTRGKEKEISLKITPQDFIHIFSKWKEKTSSSPSGRHIGHYRAILTDPELV